MNVAECMNFLRKGKVVSLRVTRITVRDECSIQSLALMLGILANIISIFFWSKYVFFFLEKDM